MALAPTSGIIKIAISVADRYVYVAGVGIFLVISYHVVLAFKIYLKRPFAKKAYVLTTVSVLVVLAVLSHARDRVWKNDQTLWTDSLKKFPDSWIAHNNLGQYYYLKGDFDNTFKHALKAHELYPADVNMIRNLLLTYLDSGNFEKAAEFGLKLLRIRKNPSADDYNKLGAVCFGLGREDLAIAYFKKATGKNHGSDESVVAMKNLIAVYTKNGDFDQAYPYLKKMLESASDELGVLKRIAPIAGKLGYYAEATTYYEKLHQMEPDDINIKINLMVLAFNRKQYSRAIEMADLIVKDLETGGDSPLFYTAMSYKINSQVSQGRYEAALSSIHMAKEFAQQAKNEKEISNLEKSRQAIIKHLEAQQLQEQDSGQGMR